MFVLPFMVNKDVYNDTVRSSNVKQVGVMVQNLLRIATKIYPFHPSQKFTKICSKLSELSNRKTDRQTNGQTNG